MASEAKRLKLDPEILTEEAVDGYEREHNRLSSLDDSVKENKEHLSLDSLPMEIIQEICMLLSLRDKMSLRLVNRQLYTICSDPYLWTNVFIDDAYHKTNAPFIKSVFKTCQPHVQSLSLRGQLPFSCYQPKILNCKNIHTLNLYGFEISLSAFEKISSPSYFPHLQYLTLTLYKTTSVKLFGMKFSCLSHLKKFVIVKEVFSGIAFFFQKWLENKCLPHIFIIVGLVSLDIEEFSEQPPAITHSAHFAVYQRYRRPLNFDFYDIPLYSLQLGPNNSETVTVTANGELMIALKDFITPTTQPNNDDFKRQYALFNDKDIPPGLPVYTSQYGINVTVLQFEFISLSLESFRLIVKDTPNVLEVSFKECTLSDCMDAYLVPLSEHCLKLRGLDVYTSVDIDVEHFWHLLSKMKSLEFLSVSCCSLISTSLCINSTTRDNMINYIKSMSSLIGLHVRNCEFFHCKLLDPNLNLRYENLLPIVSNLKSLKYLKVSFSSNAAIELKELLQNCQQLSVLDIDNAKLILPVDPALYSNLTHLRLDGTGFTSDFVTALAVNSKRRLKHYSHNNHKFIEDLALLKLMMSCSFITSSFSLLQKKFPVSEEGPNSDFDALHLH
uniref:F-box domain-containing protein n=1 Tax=Amphimedon queenslandica TaxID=400682 RepID=A0A1X7UPC3_AMPQE